MAELQYDSEVTENKKPYEALIAKCPQFITAAATIAVVYSTIFNIGYFSLVGLEYATFLSLQDLLEGTMPFLVAGFISVFVYASLDFSPTFRRETIDEFINRHWTEFKKMYGDSDTATKKVALSFVAVPIALFFFILQLFGNYILYVVLFLYVRQVTATIYKANALFTLPDMGYTLYILAGIIVLSDVLFRSVGTSIGNKHVVRFAFVTGFLAAISGMHYLAKQFITTKEWAVELSDGEIRKNTILIRSVEKGILVFDRERGAFIFLNNSSVKFIELQLGKKLKANNTQ